MDPVCVELEGQRIIIVSSSGSMWRDKELVKMVPGTKFDYDRNLWWVPLAWPACHALRGVFGDRLAIGPKLTAWAQRELETWIAPALELRRSHDVAGDPNQFPHQRVGTAWLRLVRCGLIADEMRTGKTVQGAVALDQLHSTGEIEDLPFLIVAPNGARRVWARHLERWAPGLRAAVIPKGAAQKRKVFATLDAGELDGVIINWEAVRLHSRLAPWGDIRLTDKEKEPGELNRPWSVVIADEVHRAKAPRAKQTRALWAASAESTYRWAFTGTPIANDPGDLWAILHFLMPQEWPGKTRYIDRYTMQSWNPFGALQITGLNPMTEPELRKTLDVRMLRRTQAEVWDEVPELVMETRDVELTPKERKAYEQMRKEFVAELDGGAEVVGWNPLTRATRLLQLACASLEEHIEDPCPRCGGSGQIAVTTENETVITSELVVCDDCHGTGIKRTFKLCEPSSKLDAFFELREDLGGQPLVVASPSRQLLELLAARLDKASVLYGAIHGKVAPDKRDDYIDQFQAGQLELMLLQTAAGGEGIELSRANTMTYLSRPWSMVENAQTQARILSYAKLGEKQTIIDLVTVDTFEDRVFDAQFVKGERLEEVLQDRNRLRAMLEG